MTDAAHPLAGRCAIAVMAKAPRAGHVKTRLQAVLSAGEAAALSAAFLRDVTENLREAAGLAPIDGFVAYAPAGQEERFDGVLADGTTLLLADGGGGAAADVQGFGRVLLHAMRALLDMGYGAACLLNADSPTLPTALLADAATRLLSAGSQAVLGPAEDGGYWLIGMRTAEPRVFARIDWSTERVAAQTRDRAAEAALALHLLDEWYDVDEPDSLVRLLTDLQAPPGRAFAAPATSRCVALLGLAARLSAFPA